MIVLAIVGEDATHAALIDGLIRQTVGDIARARGSWLADQLDAGSDILAWRGDQTLELDRRIVRFFKRDRAATSVGASRLGGTITVGGRKLKRHGFVGGRPLGESGKIWRDALVAVLSDDAVHAIIAAQDTDGAHAKLDGLRQVVALFRRPIIICAPHQDAEAWLVLGLGDATRRDELTRELGFDPVREPHRLTASPNSASTDAKRVLRRLMFGDDRSKPLNRAELATHAEACLPSADAIAAHGVECGVAGFCDAIRDHIAPLLDPALGARG